MRGGRPRQVALFHEDADGSGDHGFYQRVGAEDGVGVRRGGCVDVAPAELVGVDGSAVVDDAAGEARGACCGADLGDER